MITRYEIAKAVASSISSEHDRYNQIWAIKRALILNDMDLLATDREYIDDVLDILFDTFGFKA